MVEFKARVYVAEILRSDSRGVKKNRLALEWVMPMWELPGRSAIGFAAVQDATNFDPVRSSNKEEPIIGDAEAEFISPVQCLHVILTRFGKALQTGKDAHGCGFIQAANIGLAVQSRRSASSFLVVAVDLSLRDPEFRQNLLVGNGLIMLQPHTGFIERLDLFFADRFVFDGGISDSASNGVNHDFQQANHGIQLATIEPIHKFVRVLFLLGGRHQG
jgi:hypothetical protein